MAFEKPLNIDNLKSLCQEREEESLTLEFKPCNELKTGSEFRDRKAKDEVRKRTTNDILDELTRDVSAFLNSTGGVIIYGIKPKDERADELDEQNAFRGNDAHNKILPDKINHWIRAHIQPPPALEVYSILAKPDQKDSPWYIVIDIPRGETAYMARDHRFYKRVNKGVQPMEQYEVVDVMNRTKSAALDVQVSCQKDETFKEHWDRISLDISITSLNFLSSEYGAMKITALYPAAFDNISYGTPQVTTTAFSLEGDELPLAEKIMLRWGANSGHIVFPGDWLNFGQAIWLYVPSSSSIANAIYLVEIELFTINSLSKKFLYYLQFEPLLNQYNIARVDSSNTLEVISGFRETYDAFINLTESERNNNQ